MAAPLLRHDHVLLLRAALLDGDAARAAYASWRRAVRFDGVDGGSIRVLPLLYRNLRRLGVADEIGGRLKGLWRRSWLENHLRVDACAPALDALDRAGIPVMLLKGAAMVARWIDDVGSRPMADFDVLVPRPQARAAAACLVAAGWMPKPWNVTRFDDADFDAWHGAGFRQGPYEIDLHWRALRDGISDAGSAPFWDHALAATLAGRAVRVPAAEEHLFHACVHAADWSAGGRIDWVADAAMLLRGAGPGFDWTRVIALAEAQRLNVPLAALLEMLHRSLQLAIPPRSGWQRGGVAEHLEFRTRRLPPNRRGLLARGLVALQDFRRRDARWLDRPLAMAVPAFARARWQVDRAARVPGLVLFEALGRPPALRRLLADGVRRRLLARRSLPDLSLPDIAFHVEGELRDALLGGWSIPEGSGRWTDGDEASLALRTAGLPPGDVPALVRLRPFAPPRHPPVSVEVWTDAVPAGIWRFAPGDGTLQSRSLTIPAALRRSAEVVTLALRIHGAAAPASLGLSDDMRRLGIFVEQLRLAPPLAHQAFDRPLDLAAGSPDTAVLWDGWSTPEPEGTWSCTPHAGIRLRLPAPAPRGVAVELHAASYVAPDGGQPTVAVGSGGAVLCWARYTPRTWEAPLRFTVPGDALADGLLALTFHIFDAAVPQPIGDARALGLLARRLLLRPL